MFSSSSRTDNAAFHDLAVS